MWSVQPYQIAQAMRAPGGTEFAGLVDAILRAQALVIGVPDASVHTNLKNVSDGGVDTRVAAGNKDDPSGWMRHPTIWQYKATSAERLGPESLRTEIQKDYAVDCIRNGHAYRFCICDSVPDVKRTELNAVINETIRGIREDAPEGALVTTDDLAAWMRKFPAVVMRYFHAQVASIGIHLDAWGRSITASTPEYVPVDEWLPVMERLKEYVSIARPPAAPIFHLQGEAGVGKTRLVYEALRQIPGAGCITVYTDDEAGAFALAKYLVNDPDVKAILVADECRVQTRVKLASLVQGHSDRIRVVAIDNAGVIDASQNAMYRLQSMDREALDCVLSANYPNVPPQRRRAYSELSGGFVRLAADMCSNDALILAAGSIDPLIASLRDYLSVRLTESDVVSLQALSLVATVGYKDDVASELDELATFTGVPRTVLLSTASHLHDAPGFVAQAGRFFYVTPEAVAQAAFDGAWQRWAQIDAKSFLDRVPVVLLERFVGRVAQSADKEVRSLVGEFFRQYADNMQPDDFTRVEAVNKLIALVETDPHRFWPIVREKVQNMSYGQLMGVEGHAENGWGPRRRLVWLAERIMGLEGTFGDTEAILFRLAVSENEQGIANNASAIWRQLFRVWLSGTPVNFQDRLGVLKGRLESPDEKVQALALGAVDDIIDLHGIRTVGSGFVGGYVVPDEWEPANAEEQQDCFRSVLHLIQEVALAGQARDKARMIVAGRTRELLQLGLIDDIRALFDSTTLSSSERVKLVEEVGEYCRFEPEAVSPSYLEAVHSWLTALTAVDRHDKLYLLVGANPWQHAAIGDEEEWKEQLRELSAQLMDDDEWFTRELPWLLSEHALAANTMGVELGRADREASRLDELMKECLRLGSSNFVRGYVQGLLESVSGVAERINNHLDILQSSRPELAYDLFIAGGDQTHSFERTIALVDSGHIPTSYLTGLIHGVGRRELSPQEFCQLFSRAVRAIHRKEQWAVRIAFQFAAKALHSEEILQYPETTDLLWRLAEVDHDFDGTDAYWWGQSLLFLMRLDSIRAARVCSVALVGENLSLRDQAETILAAVARQDPASAMGELGQAIMDHSRGWHFSVGRHTKILQSIPTEVIADWLKKTGVEGARRIAGHLPAPYIADNGRPMVPAITEHVLQSFEDDEAVFRQFCAGIHNFQLYSGDIAQAHRNDAALARQFRDYPVKRIREWASIEEQSALRDAEYWQQYEEENDLK